MAAVSYMQSDPSYRADPAHAQSHVKHILKSPAHYQAAKQVRFKPTISMQMGSALHCLALEGEEQFNKDFIVKPDDLSLATKEGREWKALAGKKTVLSPENVADVRGMTESLRRLAWFDPGQKDYRKYNELSLYWEADKIDCKCRLDRLVLSQDEALVLDLKTTDSVESKDFLKKVIGGFNYLFQAAWYTEATVAAFAVPARFIFIGVERSAPYTTRVFEVSSEMLEEGLRQTQHARKLLAHCRKTKQWQTPEITSELLTLPPWFDSPLNSATVLSESADPPFDLF